MSAPGLYSTQRGIIRIPTITKLQKKKLKFVNLHKKPGIGNVIFKAIGMG